MTGENSEKQDCVDEVLQEPDKKCIVNNSSSVHGSSKVCQNADAKKSSVTTILRCNHNPTSALSCPLSLDGVQLPYQGNIQSCSEISQCKGRSLPHGLSQKCSSEYVSRNRLDSAGSDLYIKSSRLTQRIFRRSKAFLKDDEESLLKPAEDLKIIHHRNKFDLVFNPMKSNATLGSSKASLQSTEFTSATHLLDLTAEESNLKLKFDKRLLQRQKRRFNENDYFLTETVSDGVISTPYEPFSSVDNLNESYVKTDADFGSPPSDNDGTFRKIFEKPDENKAPSSARPEHFKPQTTTLKVLNGLMIRNRERMTYVMQMRGTNSNMAIQQNVRFGPRHLECSRIIWNRKL